MRGIGIVGALTGALLLTAVVKPKAATITASSCSASAVQAALNQATAGSTINIPAGTCTWTTPVSWTAPANVTLMGQTTCTGAGQSLTCTDNTILINGSAQLLNFTLPSTGVFRMTGLTFRSSVCGDHPMVFGAASGYATMRLDHNHWDRFCNFNWDSNNMNGVADHNWYNNVGGAPGANQVRPFGADNDTEWTNPTNFGSASNNWFYVEDSRWDFGISNDCFSSGRQVFRYNYMNGSGVQEHGTGHSGQNRGCRGLEVYGNTIIGDTNANRTTAVAIYSGSGRVWGNTVDFSCTNCSSAVMLDLVEDRQSNYTYTQSATPSGWSYCGTNFNGTGSVWDGNQDASGYPCLDQVGRGPGDLLSGNFSTKRNNTRNCTVTFSWANRAASCDGSNSSAWPRQALEPVYEWLNSGTASAGWVGVFRSPASTANIQANRDYYVGHGNTSCNAGAGSCTAGVGTGTRAQRPANCTTGVAYWSTDQGGNWNTANGTANDGTLDVCTATNTWTNSTYTPYTYPHPLAQGITLPVPSAPNNLRITSAL